MLRFHAVLLLILGVSAICMPASQSAAIGTKVADFQLEDSAGGVRSLQSYSGKVVVLVFWSFKCPVSLAYNDRIEALQRKYGDRGVAVLGVASGANETPAEIRANVANLNFPLPVLLDSEGMLAQSLGATHTPGVFILDGGAVLRYRGALDNNKKTGDSGRIAYAEDALDAILSGRAVAVAETTPFGCTIRRKTL